MRSCKRKNDEIFSQPKTVQSRLCVDSILSSHFLFWERCCNCGPSPSPEPPLLGGEGSMEKTRFQNIEIKKNPLKNWPPPPLPSYHCHRITTAVVLLILLSHTPRKKNCNVELYCYSCMSTQHCREIGGERRYWWTICIVCFNLATAKTMHVERTSRRPHCESAYSLPTTLM